MPEGDPVLIQMNISHYKALLKLNLEAGARLAIEHLLRDADCDLVRMREKETKDAVMSAYEFQVAPLEDENAVAARLVVQGADDMRPSVELILDPDYAFTLALDLRRAAEQVIQAREKNSATATKH